MNSVLFALSVSGSKNGGRGSLAPSLGLCLGSLVASGPAKVVGPHSAAVWMNDWPTDFGGPAADDEATKATATGMAPGIRRPPAAVPARPDHRVANNQQPSPVVQSIPAKPDHRLITRTKTLKTQTQTTINDQTISKTWLV